MVTPVRRKVGLVGALAAALLASHLAPHPALAAEPLGAATPEKLVERLRVSAEKKDFRELASCLAPEPRKELAQMIWVGATMMIGMSSAMGEMGADMAAGMAEGLGADADKAKAEAAKGKKELEAKMAAITKRYDEVAKKHGLPGLKDEGEVGDPETLFAKVDTVAMIGDFAAVLDSFGDATGTEAPQPPVPQGKLLGLKIDGDKATGTLEGEPIHFVRIDGRWFIAELPKKKGADGAGE